MFPAVVGQSTDLAHTVRKCRSTLGPNNAKVKLRFRPRNKLQKYAVSSAQVITQSKLQLGIQNQVQAIAAWLLLWQDQALR